MFEQAIEQFIVPFVFVFLQGLAQRIGKSGGAFAFDFFGGRNSFAPDPALRESLDVFEAVDFAPGDERDGLAALPARPGRPIRWT